MCIPNPSQPLKQPPIVSIPSQPHHSIPNPRFPKMFVTILTTTTLSIATLIIFTYLHPFHRYHRIHPCNKHPNTSHCPSCDSKPIPIPPIPHTLNHCSHGRGSAQARTIQAIEMAVAEARFRRWGEEQGWSGCRMGSERSEFREGLVGKVGWAGWD